MNVNEITPSNETEATAFAPPQPANAGANKYNSYLSNLERDKTVADADIVEKGAAFMMSYGQMNGGVNIINWGINKGKSVMDYGASLQSVFGVQDDTFTEAWDEEAIISYAKSSGFGMKEYPKLAKANSAPALAAITYDLNEEKNNDWYIQNHITNGVQGAGMMLGAVLDADVLIPAAKIKKVNTLLNGAKIAKATPIGMRKEIALYTTWETAHAMVNDDYTAADAVMGVAAASLLSVSVTKYQAARQNKAFAEYSNTHAKGDSDVPITKSGEANGAGFNDSTPTPKDKNPELIVEDYLQKYKWTDEPSVIKVGDNLEPKKLDEPDEVFNSQLSDMLNDVMVAPRKTIDDMVEEVVNTVTAAKIDGIDPNSSKIVRELNDLMGLVRKASKDVALQLDDIVKIKFNKNKNGTYTLKTPNGKKFGKVVPATLAVALTGTAASASEDDSIAFSTVGAAIMAIGIAGVAGTASYKAWAKSDGRLASTITKVKGSIAKSTQSVDVATQNPILKNIRGSGQILRTRLTETYQRFADYGGDAKDLADKLLVNFADGTVQSAEIMKRRFSRIAEANVATVENAEFVNWLEAQGMKHRPLVNFLENNEMLNKFREEITDAIDGGVGTREISPQAQKVANEFKTQMRGIYDEMVAANVKGYRETVLADASTLDTAVAFGMTTSEFAAEGLGKVTKMGRVNSVDTAGIGVNGTIYLSDIGDGSLTGTPPEIATVIGYVIKAQSQAGAADGIIYVNPQNIIALPNVVAFMNQSSPTLATTLTATPVEIDAYDDTDSGGIIMDYVPLAGIITAPANGIYDMTIDFATNYTDIGQSVIHLLVQIMADNGVDAPYEVGQSTSYLQSMLLEE